MARPLRIQQSEYPYHVTTRVANGEFHFKSVKFQRKFLKMYASVALRASRRYRVKLHHMVVMDNHHHLYLSTPKANISKYMQYFNARVAEGMNKMLNRTGPFWNGRFHATILPSEEDQKRAIKYIYNNPVRANMVDNAVDYELSTVVLYAFGRRAFVNVTPDDIFLSLGETEEEQRARFIKEFLEIEPDDKELEEFRASLSARILGSADEIARILEKYDPRFQKKKSIEQSEFQTTK